MKFRVDGGEQLARNLADLSPRLSRQVQHRALHTGGEPMQERAAALAPRGEGPTHLAEEIGIMTSRDLSTGDPTVAIGPEWPAFYGIFQEFGTRHHGAQPFMRPAFEQVVRQTLNIITGELWRALVSRGFSTRGSDTGGGTL